MSGRPEGSRRHVRETVRPGARTSWLPPLGFWITCAVAFAIRLAYVLEIRDTPIAELLLIDSETYDRFARLLLAGRFQGEDVYSMNVLYPHFLAAVYALFGAVPWKAMVVQAVLSAIHAGLVFLLARRFFDPATAWIAGLGAALYPPYVFYSGALLTPTLIDLCVLGSLLALGRWIAEPRAAWLLVSGILTGLSALGRGSGLLFVALVAPVLRLATGAWRSAAPAWGVFALGALGVTGAVTLRNAVVDGGFVPIAANYAAFHLGHHDRANGLYSTPDVVAGAGFDDEVTGVREALSREAGRELTQAEASAELFRRGVRWAIDHPAEEAKLALTKTWYFWNRTESPTNLSLEFAKEFSPLLRALPIHFGIVAPLGLAGIVLTRRRWRELAALHATIAMPWITCVVFFVSAEYRLPAVAPLLAFAAHAVARAGALAWASVARRSAVARGRTSSATARKGVRPSREGAVALALLPAFAIACHFQSPLLVAQTKNRVSFYNFGVLYEQRDRLDQAEAMQRRALAIDPRYAPALNALAGVERRRGRTAEAARHLAAARAAAPGDPLVPEDDHSRVEAEALYQAGSFEEAREAFERAHDHYRRLGRAEDAIAMLNNLGLTLHRLGRNDEAEALLKRLVAESPGYVRAHNNLARVYESIGRTSEAMGEYRRALELDPENERARRALERLAGR